MKTYIVGHKNPDTDSVVSAIALAELKKFFGESCKPTIAGEINKETSFVLKKFGFKKPQIIPKEKKKVILVDHNESSQISENVKPEEITAIFDHHKAGCITTQEPILINIIPCGSTSTIIAGMFKNDKIKPSKKVASLLIAGIISDTLYFNSPTTTEFDKKTVYFLNKITKLNLKELSQNMFKAKSDLSGVSTKEVVNADYKEFNIRGKKVGVGVFETVFPEAVLERTDEIIKILKMKKIKEKLNYLLFAIIDILKKEALFLVPEKADEDILMKIFKPQKKEGYFLALGIVSRKKQIIPKLEKFL